MNRYFILLPLMATLAGCPVTQPQDVPVKQLSLTEPVTGRKYSLYVPSYYTPERKWPLVITLHGTFGWDGRVRQVKEWKYLAEQKGLIVAAPAMKSVQGILPVIKSLWLKDLASDEKVILAMLEDLSGKYNIASDAVMLTGFSAGGYPMYYAGLRNPEKFSILCARACNSSIEIFERVEFTEAVRKMPVIIFWGKDDLLPLHKQAWQAFRYLRERRCFKTEKKVIVGGHLRRPALAYRTWLKYLPNQYKVTEEED